MTKIIDHSVSSENVARGLTLEGLTDGEATALVAVNLEMARKILAIMVQSRPKPQSNC